MRSSLDFRIGRHDSTIPLCTRFYPTRKSIKKPDTRGNLKITEIVHMWAVPADMGLPLENQNLFLHTQCLPRKNPFNLDDDRHPSAIAARYPVITAPLKP